MKMRRVDARQFDTRDWYDHVVYMAQTKSIGRYNRLPLDINVRLCNRLSSAGRNFGGWNIKVVAGNDPADVKECVVHEAAHTLAGVSHGHDATFYVTLITLAKACGVPLEYVVQRESWYKPRGLNKALRSMHLTRLVR